VLRLRSPGDFRFAGGASGASACLRGVDRAGREGVGARRVEELAVWQLADEIRCQVHALAAADPAKKDFRFCDQLRNAASPISSNVAEGFGRFGHREFAQFLTIARGSLFEVKDHLKDGVARGYWTSDDCEDLQKLCNRTIAAVTRLIRYLRSTPDLPHSKSRHRKHDQRS
jgi:four helix bundle protein